MPSLSEPIYSATVDGVRWWVLDARMHQGTMVVANPPAAWATLRVFRPEQRQRRLYYLKPGESRAPKPALFALRLERAEFLPAEKRQAYNPKSMMNIFISWSVSAARR